MLSHRRPLRALSALLLAAALAWSAPAHAGNRLGQPDLVEDALAYATTDRAKALALLEEAATSTADHDEALVLAVYAGEQRRLSGDKEGARGWFERVLESGDGAPAAAARLGLALLTVDAEPDASTWAILEDTHQKSATATQNACRYLALAVRAAGQNDLTALERWSRKALDYAAEDPEVEARVTARLEALTAPPTGPDVEPEPGPGPDTPEPEAEAVLPALQAAWAALDHCDAAAAREGAQALVDAGGDDAWAAKLLLRRLDAVPVDPGKVGVLLPTSGRYQAAAHQILEAVKVGLGTGGPELVVADTGEDAASAVAALEQLVLEDGVVAVVGPLRRDVAEDVARAADALHVPLLSLTREDGLTAERPWVYQAMPTPASEARVLVAHAVEERGMSAFAIFAPDNAYGHAAADAFTAAVEEQGAQVTVAEYYDATATDLIPFAKTLGRKDYEARSWEFHQLKAAARERGGDPSKVVLPPILDFQGLFLPDSAARVPLATAALAYEEFPIGEFQTERDGDTVPLMGLSSWNNPSLVTAGNIYVRSSIFTDAWWDGDATGQAFVERYRQATGRGPSSLEVYAHDAGAILGAVTGVRPPTREDFREALSGAEVEGTVTGVAGFNEERQANHDIRILTICKDGVFPPDQVPNEELPE